MLHIMQRAKVTLSMKSLRILELPSTLLTMERLLKSGNTKVYYPSELMELWKQSNEHIPSGEYVSVG